MINRQMIADKTKTKKGIKFLTKSFWSLSRQRQEAFLKNLYDLSPENKALFTLRLGNDKSAVFEALKKDIKKETINRIGKFKKIRLAKINTILRNTQKYALPIIQQIELKKEVWLGMLAFIISKKHLPDRYQVACARHLDQYLKMVEHHILEKSEVEDILAKDKEILMTIIDRGFYLPSIEDVYLKYFFE